MFRFFGTFDGFRFFATLPFSRGTRYAGPAPRARKPDAGDPAAFYLREVGAVPPLSAEEEQRLIKRIVAGERAELRLAEANLALVAAIARRFSNSSAHTLNLIQVGNEGLPRAVKTCGAQPGKRFVPYARKRIREAIQRRLAEQP